MPLLIEEARNQLQAAINNLIKPNQPYMVGRILWSILVKTPIFGSKTINWSNQIQKISLIPYLQLANLNKWAKHKWIKQKEKEIELNLIS